MANPSPQHNPTDGLGTATQVTLTGTGVSATPGGYKVTLSLSGTSTVALTAAFKDVGGNAFTSGNSNVVAYKSYNTNVATVSGGTVTAVAVGQAVIDASFPTFDTTSGVDKVYVQLLVTVTV